MLELILVYWYDNFVVFCLCVIYLSFLEPTSSPEHLFTIRRRRIRGPIFKNSSGDEVGLELLQTN